MNPDAVFTYSVSNRGKLAAVVEKVSVGCGYERGGRGPPLRIMGDHYLVQMPIISSNKTFGIFPTASLGSTLITIIPTSESFATV